ncbi:MAG: glycosyltransferase [Christensenellales bacterium]
MSTKKAVLISCFNYYDIRLKHVENYLKQADYEVTYITSDYDHIAKEPYSIDRVGAMQVHARPYNKNLSLKRMLSHFIWAKVTFQKVKALKPELLFVMLPPNSLARHAARYKMRNNVKLIFDIYDLWPETYPLGRNPLMKFPFYLWRQMRDKYLRCADLVTTECDMYQEKLAVPLKGLRVETLYPALDDVQVSRKVIWDDNVVHLAYLGSVNNIIDIPMIAKLIGEMQKHKPVHLHIIGSGESKATLVAEVKQVGAFVTDYGPIYDPQKKQAILDRCRFGLNIMRDTVCVGLTMKSIDYFRAGIPIINTIRGDSAKIVDAWSTGFNVSSFTLTAEEVLTSTQPLCAALRVNSRKVYKLEFSTFAFRSRLDSVLSSEVTR